MSLLEQYGIPNQMDTCHPFPEIRLPAGFDGYLKFTKLEEKSFLSFSHACGVCDGKIMHLGGVINLPELYVLGPHD